MAGHASSQLPPVAPEMFVPDVEAAIRFYTERLGFTLRRKDTGHGFTDFAELVLDEAVVMFAHESLFRGGGTQSAADRGGMVDTRIMVRDVDATYRRAREHGVTVVLDIADRAYGLRDFIIRDLNGFRIRFAAPVG